MSPRGRLGQLARGALLAFLAIYSLFPIYMVFIESVKSTEENVLGNPLVVYHPTAKWYLGLLEPAQWLSGEIFVRRIPVLVWLENTAIVLVVSLFLILAASLAAAYALGRLRPPGWRTWRRFLFVAYLVPQTLLFLPMYRLVFRLGLDDNLLALILVYPMLAMPFCVWLLSAYFQRLAPEIEESALIEGADRWTCFLRVLLPMSWPVITAAGIFALGVISSDVMFASVFLPNQFHQTLAAGLGAADVSMGDLTVVAGVNLAALSVVPVAAAFAGAYVRGLTAAMVEGA